MTYIQVVGGQIGKSFEKSGQCEVCKKTGCCFIFDCATNFGPWANLCENCFEKYGIGLGVGRGQKYQKIV